MDTRAELLIDELSTHPVGQPFDFKHWRERFQTLFAEPLDWETREPLLKAYANTLDFVERSLVSQGLDPTDFRNAREADWRTLCIQEALHRSKTDLFAPDDLNEIVQREVSAGRLEESSFTQLAADGATFLENGQRQQEPKKGFLKRLFG
jgi:hypothetical protein